MPRSSYAKFKTRLIFSSSLLIALLAAMMFWKIGAGMEADREAAFGQTQSFARAMSAHVESETRVVDLSLLRSAEALGAMGQRALTSPERARQILAMAASVSDASFWIHFIDARGVGIVASNGLPIAGVAFADRSYFTAHLQNRGAGLHVAAPEIGRVSGRRVFFLSRGVFSQEGEWMGVVVASVDAATIANVFTSALIQPSLSITLLHAGGTVVARAPLFASSFASNLSGSDLFRHSKETPSGSYEGLSAIDGQRRVFSYHKVGSTPLAVAVGIAVDSWRRDIMRDAVVAAAALSVMALALLFMGRFALLSFLRLEESQADQQRLNEELRGARDENARGEKRARMIADGLPALVAYIDANERYVFHNSFYRTLFGQASGSMVGRSIREVLGDKLHASIAPEVRAALGGARVSFQKPVEVGGARRWFNFEYTPDVDDAGATLGFYSMGTDVTDMKEAQRRLSIAARFDELTGLPNRSQLYERLTEALARSKRAGAETACLFLDIDHFKSINDSLGHAGGDEALREFARRLRSTARETDLVARLAGDEFVVVLEGGQQPEMARVVARKVIEAMSQPFDIAGSPLQVSTSIGIAVSDGEKDDADAMLKRADDALYAAKRAGRGRFALAAAPCATLI